jgi:hypothetical protein
LELENLKPYVCLHGKTIRIYVEKPDDKFQMQHSLVDSRGCLVVHEHTQPRWQIKKREPGKAITQYVLADFETTLDRSLKHLNINIGLQRPNKFRLR